MTEMELLYNAGLYYNITILQYSVLILEYFSQDIGLYMAPQ